MRRALEITPETEQEQFVHRYDLREIDASNTRDFWRLLYTWRLRLTTGIIMERVPAGSRILEIGCAQGNLSITLAEAGYQVTGVDLKPGFISYARKKDDRGLVRWVNDDAFALGSETRFAAVVMGELIEHVTAPVELIRRALALLQPGGLLVLTTPSHHAIINTLPTFEEAKRSTDGFKGVSIGPAGEDHIFAYTSGEMRQIVEEAGGRIVTMRYTGSVLLNTRVQWLLNIPVVGAAYFALVRAISFVPPLARLVSPTLLLALRAAGQTELRTISPGASGTPAPP